MWFSGRELHMIRGDDEEFTVEYIEDTTTGTTTKKFTSSDTVKLLVGTYTPNYESGSEFKFSVTGTVDTTLGTCTISIASATTASLDLGYNQYMYTIQVTNSGKKRTLYPASPFVLEKEVPSS